ncbi:MAG: RiPP maturation radical SAM C-methyltransferase [Thermoanaerobaculia bacterium]
MHDVVLVVMPYASVERPSVALGTLHACLLRDGIAAHAMHATLRFADEIGLVAYESINSAAISNRIGEWTFAAAAFPDADLRPDEYLETLSKLSGEPPRFAEQLLAVRETASAFVDRIAREVLAMRPRIVGCSSVFQQQCASLALLRRIHELDPTVITILGGGNCEGEMGWIAHQSFDWIDYVVSGEADELIAPLCRDILAFGRDVPASRLGPGVFAPSHRNGNDATPSAHALYARVRSMTNVPQPIYDEYFESLSRTRFHAQVVPGVSIETARGCWWGEKHHCSFCGISDSGMVFRAKPAAQVLDEIDSLHAKYGIHRFVTADNIIETSYFDTLMPKLTQRELSLFYQTKANLKRHQVELLARAGVRWIQPGIESLDDRVLPLLAKGASAAINVQLMKWCREFGVWLLWNLLFGAPGEEDVWYEELAEWLPLIAHLQPPSSGELTAIRYNRFSPYFDNAKEHGLELVPYWAYQHTYPHDEKRRARQAYYFTDLRDVAKSARAHERRGVQSVLQRLREWNDLFIDADSAPIATMRDDAPVLAMTRIGDRITLRDTRPCAIASVHELSSQASAVLLACDAATTIPAIAATTNLGISEVESIIDALHARKLILSFGERVLALATSDPPASYPDPYDFPGGLLLRAPMPARPWDLPIAQLFTTEERGAYQ